MSVNSGSISYKPCQSGLHCETESATDVLFLTGEQEPTASNSVLCVSCNPGSFSSGTEWYASGAVSTELHPIAFCTARSALLEQARRILALRAVISAQWARRRCKLGRRNARRVRLVASQARLALNSASRALLARLLRTPLPPTARRDAMTAVDALTDIVVVQNCAAGYFADQQGSTSCKSCAAGTFSASGASTCTQCKLVNALQRLK